MNHDTASTPSTASIPATATATATAQNHGTAPVLRTVLHAPSSEAFARARSNARNLRREAPDAEVRIVLNADAVAAALDTPHPHTDPFTWLCPNTLAHSGRSAPEALQVLPVGAVLALAQWQQQGWIYLSA